MAFFIRVYLVEDNTAYNLTETITSLSHIKEDYKAGDKLTIDLYTPPIAFTVTTGGKIRVDISSDGGIYVPHANQKGHWAEVCDTKIANNTVYLKDSFIELTMESVDLGKGLLQNKRFAKDPFLITLWGVRGRSLRVHSQPVPYRSRWGAMRALPVADEAS